LKTFIVTDDQTGQGPVEEISKALEHQTEVIHFSELNLINNLKPDFLLCVCNEKNFSKILAPKNFSVGLLHVPLFVFLESWNTEMLQELYKYDIVSYFFPDEIVVMPHGIQQLLDMEDCRKNFHRLKQELEHNQRILSTYVTSDIIEKNRLNTLASAKGGEILQATILIFDIRQSTAIAEMVHPDIFSDFLSDLLSDIMDLIYGHGGHVNKMLGDGLLATFGCPTSGDNDPLNAVNCALQIREYLKTYNDVRPEYIPFSLKGGIGIATGKVFAGDIGSIRKTEYTVLGDCVNTASRIESLTKAAGVDILIDGATYEHTKNKVKVQKVVYKNIRGKSNRIDIYYLKSAL